MKRESLLNVATVFGVAGLLVVGSSCEWDRADDDATWNDAYESKYEWVNFSGVYQHTSGWYVVTQFRRPSSGSGSSSGGGGGGGSSGVQIENVGTGNGGAAGFGGQLSNIPIVPGSVTISGQLPGGSTEVFSDVNIPGVLESNYPGGNPWGDGSINYYSGAFSVVFAQPVADTTTVTAIYISGSSSSVTSVVITTNDPNRPRQGSSEPIYQLSVVQDGYRLTFRDNYGNVYRGRIISIASTAGGVATDIRPGEAVDLIATFEAEGSLEVDGNNVTVTLTGTLEGTYTAAAEDTTIDPAELANPTENETPDYRGTMENRVIRGVWVEEDGTTGEIEGVSTAPADFAGN